MLTFWYTQRSVLLSDVYHLHSQPQLRCHIIPLCPKHTRYLAGIEENVHTWACVNYKAVSVVIHQTVTVEVGFEKEVGLHRQGRDFNPNY